jgi:hypothetical protein
MARGLMSNREKALYQDLIVLYPDHKIFVQVALSQLLDVARDHPERESIRARFKQLVADFVLCRPDLSIVAVIELDDRSHFRDDRKRADARKSKAISDAGIRLVRIPAGPIPPLGTLKALIEEKGSEKTATVESPVRRTMETPMLSFGSNGATKAARSFGSGKSKKMKTAVCKIGVTVLFVIFGYFAYSTLLSSIIRQAFQPMASNPQTNHNPPSAAVPPRSATNMAMVSAAPSQTSNNSATGLAGNRAEAMALQKQKTLAWTAFYSAPSSCEHPPAWNDQVECGNQYMRAKRRFEEQWAAAHPADGAQVSSVLDNAAIIRSRPASNLPIASQ